MRELSDEKVRVVIVGAGLAGLSAANRLSQAGISEIALLEAQSVAGGRVRSVELGGGYVELGAQWLHGSRSELCRLAQEAGLLSQENSFEGLGDFYCEDGTLVSPSVVQEVSATVAEIMTQLEAVSDESPPLSVAEFMSEKFEEYLKSSEDSSLVEVKRNLFDWNVRFQVIDNACSDLSKLSSQAFGNYKFVGGDDYINLKEGFVSVISELVNRLPPDCLHTDCPVTGVCWSSAAGTSAAGGCRVTTATGKTFLCDHVIVTCSVGYLKNNWSLFEPPLPTEIIKSFNCIGFDTINKIFLEYEEAWWGESRGLQFVWDRKARRRRLGDSAESWTCELSGFDPLIGLPTVLVGWLGGEGAEESERLSEETLGEHCTQLFRSLLRERRIPRPQRCLRSAWGSNEYIRGGYSHIRVDQDRNKSYLKTLLKPLEVTLTDGSQVPVIFFAGEALHEKYYSTTHGAFESGKSQADKLVTYISGSVCLTPSSGAN